MNQPQPKPFLISKHAVLEAWERVKANQGAAGIDAESIQDFERQLKDNLYRIWNRMSSGSYLPPPVRTVAIPKAGGGERKLGIPTVADRVAQMVVKRQLEPRLERLFHADSYGYRPFKSAHEAVGRARQRGWRYDWVLDLDIKGFFDILRGWVQYYGHYYRSMLHPIFRPLDRTLVRWACRKYKKLRGHHRRAAHWLRRISVREPKLWAHWEIGVRGRVL